MFSPNYSLKLTQSSIIFQIVGSSEIEVASFLAGGQHLMKAVLSSMCVVCKVAYFIASPTPCVSSSESRIICHTQFLSQESKEQSFSLNVFAFHDRTVYVVL